MRVIPQRPDGLTAHHDTSTGGKLPAPGLYFLFPPSRATRPESPRSPGLAWGVVRAAGNTTTKGRGLVGETGCFPHVKVGAPRFELGTSSPPD